MAAILARSLLRKNTVLIGYTNFHIDKKFIPEAVFTHGYVYSNLEILQVLPFTLYLLKVMRESRLEISASDYKKRLHHIVSIFTKFRNSPGTKLLVQK